MLKNNLLAFSLLTATATFAQYADYTLQRQLHGIENQWHNIVLPEVMFNDVSPSLNDLRIIGITESGDTIEAPYLIKQERDTEELTKVEFSLLNESRNDEGYFFTFEISQKEIINRIELDFARKNFDWKITLSGSHDQQEWFTLLNDYRIVGISNALTEYKFTELKFPDAKFQYFRLQIKSEEKPEFQSAGFSQYKSREGHYKTYEIAEKSEKLHQKDNIIDIKLENKVPVNFIKIEIKDSIDYYRPIIFEYPVDSTETKNGWKIHYRTIHTDVINSEEKNIFRFQDVFIKKLRLRIENGDNRPLHTGTIEVKGYVYKVVARFTEPATYYLLYGSKRASKPVYDIEQFQDKIPENPASIELGEEEIRDRKEDLKKEALFKNPLWLWTIIIAIVLILGFFTFNMMRKVDTDQS